MRGSLPTQLLSSHVRIMRRMEAGAPIESARDMLASSGLAERVGAAAVAGDAGGASAGSEEG